MQYGWNNQQRMTNTMSEGEHHGEHKGGRGGHKRGWQEGRDGRRDDPRDDPRGKRRGERHGDFGPEFGGRGGRGQGPRGGRDRMRRGDARTILLDALRDGPKHGYEIIKALEERSGGQYVPSPGTVYPTLQLLEDQGLVRSTQEGERRTYQLTDAGQAELEVQAKQVDAFWERFGAKDVAAGSHQEVRFLEDELDHLNRIVWSGLRPAIVQGRHDTVRQVRKAVEECQDKIREILSSEQNA